jgi:hypothetical protein
MRNGMINRFAFVIAVTLLCVGCTTDFQSWESADSVVEGRGGTKKVVDGMDVWTFGDPPRRFKVLGIIQNERPGGPLYVAQLTHDVVKKAREHGGNAVILVTSASQLTGYYSMINVGRYGSGSATTIPVTRRNSTYVVIKYLG